MKCTDKIFSLQERSADTQKNEFAKEVFEGLLSKPKRIPCRWLYDEKGSQLFEEICTLSEYYPTRAEKSILEKRAEEIADLFDCAPIVMELGSGNAQKSRILLKAILHRHGPLHFMPVDISREILVQSVNKLLIEHPEIQTTAVAGDYVDGLSQLEKQTFAPRLVLWLGGSIGNLEPSQAISFLALIGRHLLPTDRLLMGIDLRKDHNLLLSAYDDSLGVTAQFNKNLLKRINRELEGDIQPEYFEHLARYNEQNHSIEMHLVSKRYQRAMLKKLSLEVKFEPNEWVHTESSFKYSMDQISWLLHGAGFQLEKQWLDNKNQFSVNLARICKG